jgi:hypothetical protein
VGVGRAGDGRGRDGMGEVIVLIWRVARWILVSGSGCAVECHGGGVRVQVGVLGGPSG